MNYYAHSKPGEPRENWQSLAVHSYAAGELAGMFAGEFDSGDWGQLAGELHDLGKAGKFQEYLASCNGFDDVKYDADGSNSNHAAAGALWAEETFKLPGRILAYLIAGHHTGLPDYGALDVRLKGEGKVNLDSIRRNAADFIAQLPVDIGKLPPWVRVHNMAFWVRMLFSCLVDADYLDTEKFMQPEQNLLRGAFADMGELKRRFDAHMANLAAKAAPTEVNAIRQTVLGSCREAAFKEPGLFSLTVPTGGGKTLSAMAFALDHAVKYKKRRIVYVIPYTSIIEQTAQILRGIFGDDQVIEHHSNLDPAKETMRSRLAAENWDAPIIVTTSVQFFESLHAARPAQCRKLHRLANSVIILDEAQLLPPDLLKPCVEAIEHLTTDYGVSLVLATATQPALFDLAPREIIPEGFDLYVKLKRTQIAMPEDLIAGCSWEAIASELKEHEQILCIVNTRQDCYDLFQLMPEGTIHLSASMCPKHRTKVIASIKTRLKAGEPIRVISTQLVEAGVDIDFPVVYRALAGMDSIAQAAGRCNREGRAAQPGMVKVFVPPEPISRGLQVKATAATCSRAAVGGLDFDSPVAFTEYFKNFYSRVNAHKVDFHKLLVLDAPYIKISFRTVAENFRMIDEAGIPVVVDYAGSGTWIERLRKEGPTREIMRALQSYTVNLREYLAKDWLLNGNLEDVAGIQVVMRSDLYDEEIGLDIFKDRQFDAHVL